MQKKQFGFAAQGALLLLVVVAVLVGAGYIVLKRQNKETASLADSTESTSNVQKITVPVDGTPKSAVSEITNQLSEEVKSDDSFTDEETANTKVDDSVAKEAENSVNEKNL